MQQESLAQWADRMAASHYTVQRSRPQLNRRTLVQAQRSRELEALAVKAHEERQAARQAAASPVAKPASPPSLGGGLLSRIGLGGAAKPPATPATPPEPSASPRLLRRP